MSMSIAGDVASVVTATVALLVVVGGYVQFVPKRSSLPCVEFDVDFTTQYRGSKQIVGEVSCMIRNVGSSMLVVSNVRCRVRYRLADDPEDSHGPIEPNLRHAVRQSHDGPGSWFCLVEQRTFVQPGVTQRYRKPIATPVGVVLLDVVGSFDYRIEIGGITYFLIGIFARPPKDLDWRKGISKHTARRMISISAGAAEATGW
jgi:hypothetical protein